MKVIHYYESTDKRRIRLQSKTVHGQAICGTGDGHQTTTGAKWAVTCPACQDILVEIANG